MSRRPWLGWTAVLVTAACAGCGEPDEGAHAAAAGVPADSVHFTHAGPPVPPVPTFDTVREGRTHFGGVTLGGGRAWVLSRDSRIDKDEAWRFATPDSVTLDAIDVVSGAVVTSTPLVTGATAGEIATDGTSVFVHACHDTYPGAESTVYTASMHCYNHRTGVLSNTAWGMVIHPGPQQLAMAVGEDGHVLAVTGYGSLMKFSPECARVAYQLQLGPPVTPPSAYEANWKAYQTWSVPVIVEDRVLLVDGFNRLVEFDYETLDILRRVPLATGHARLPILVTPQRQTVLYGGLFGFTILDADLSVSYTLNELMVGAPGPAVALSNGYFTNVHVAAGEVVLWRTPEHWLRHAANPGVGYYSTAAPTVSPDGEIWALGIGIGDAFGEVGLVISGFRETTEPSGKSVDTATRRTFLGPGEPLTHTVPAMPRDEQVIYVTKHGVHSRKLEGLRMPEPTHWSTAHGNMARDRRWRPPRPGSVPASAPPRAAAARR